MPFFLFTLPAGALADLSNRRNLLIAVYLWLAVAAGLLAVCTWLHWVHPYVILTTVFLLGIGFAFNAPVWASIVPEIVQKEELASAITLGGVQMNLAGIVGPALGGLLLPIVGPAMLFSLNALAFLTMAWVISQRYHRRRRPEPHLENFLESFASAARYVRYTPGMQVILTRDFLFGLFIAAVPALVPVVALQHLRLQASQLGLVFTSMGIGSLLGATLIASLRSRQSQPKRANDFGRRHSGRGSCLDGHRSKPLDVSARDRLGRHQLDGVGFRTLDRRTTGNARLGSRTDERCPPDGLTRRGGARRRPLGWGSDVRGSRSNAGGRRPAPDGQSDVGHPALNKLRPLPQP